MTLNISPRKLTFSRAMAKTTVSPLVANTSSATIAVLSNSSTNDTDQQNATDCWNVYCYDEEEYLNAIEEHIFPKNFEWFFVFLYTVTFIVGLVGNSLVCFAVWRNNNMRTVTNVFIVNLALGDFLVILLCLPPTLVQDIALTWFLGPAMCKALLFLQVNCVLVAFPFYSKQTSFSLFSF